MVMFQCWPPSAGYSPYLYFHHNSILSVTFGTSDVFRASDTGISSKTYHEGAAIDVLFSANTTAYISALAKSRACDVVDLLSHIHLRSQGDPIGTCREQT
jgi:hypothetical protein